MNEFLSICIPTYNRAVYLQQTLKAFLPLVKPHQIPIYVSDNGSTDGTVEMLTKFKNEYYPLTFFKTSVKNLGIDRNIANAIAMASSQYIWLFGDDDLPHESAVECILDNIKSGYKLIILNASTYNSDFSKQIEKKRVGLSQDRVYGESEQGQLLIDAAGYTCFLGCLVVEKSAWDSIPHEEYIGSDYVHVAVVFRYIVGNKALFLAQPLIDIRLGAASWSRRYFEVELINWPRIIWSLPEEHYPFGIKKRICQKYPTRSIRRILATRAYGYYGRTEYVQYIQPDIAISKWKKKLLMP